MKIKIGGYKKKDSMAQSASTERALLSMSKSDKKVLEDFKAEVKDIQTWSKAFMGHSDSFSQNVIHREKQIFQHNSNSLRSLLINNDDDLQPNTPTKSNFF